ncbi:hypothetical protein HJG60_011902 [Phyllostomus discolor]|uniref:DUF1725 domain-containing protein n=1 Tax=Phyllostomus discolor TaxID=89673 RepID=A0A833ZD54_9CHIR|nr:hypothetical protein HJG60_011902 [Phyllostomus discolor]
MRVGKKRTLVHCWWECRLVQPLWKAVWRFLKKLKLELPYDPAIPLLGIYPKKPRTLVRRNICPPMFNAALFAIAKMWKQPKCPSVGECIKKLWYICTTEYYLTVKNKEISHFVTAWMDLENIILSQKDKYCMISPTCGM